MIREVQDFWNGLEDKKVKKAAEHFGLSPVTVKKYIQMTASEVENAALRKDYKKRSSPMNGWLNVIFKMMADGHSSETIYFYVRGQPDFTESREILIRYIYLIGRNNFTNRVPFRGSEVMEYVLPSGVVSFKRTEILKYILTCNPKVQKDVELGKYIDAIKEKYPIVSFTENVFMEFHGIIIGKEPDKVNEFIERYSNSQIDSFCCGLKRDIAPVKNAISHPESSGFVEGNNNKFKLIKRIVYGRSGLVNLSKKCKLAFMPQDEKLSLLSLI
ncbi:MAG: transposase [Lachnospiraceae bacterium]|nr:transposase [Lachnospiraceae bacterium]MDE6253565.1 transposase [Lachnospiraceae bacterium]